MTGTGLARVVAVFAGLTLLPACTSPAITCTDIGAASGIGVTVVSAIAPDVQSLTVKLCRGQTCREVPVDLSPGSVTVGETCSGSGPADVCSASASPDGSKVGFVVVEDLAEAPVMVSAAYRHDGKPVTTAAVQVSGAPVFPNGPDCGAAGHQGAIRLVESGLEIAG